MESDIPLPYISFKINVFKLAEFSFRKLDFEWIPLDLRTLSYWTKGKSFVKVGKETCEMEYENIQVTDGKSGYPYDWIKLYPTSACIKN